MWAFQWSKGRIVSATHGGLSLSPDSPAESFRDVIHHAPAIVRRWAAAAGIHQYLPDDEGWTRHLIWYCYPVAGNGTWQRNVDRLMQRMPLFNGRKIVAVATADGSHRLDSVADVSKRFNGCVEIIQVQHEHQRGEVTAFVPLLERIADHQGPRDVAFYGHSKGATHRLDNALRDAWGDLMYRCNLDHWPIVRDALESHCMAGAFKGIMPWSFGYDTNGQALLSQWHYRGTFFWMRLRDVFARAWRRVPKSYGGTEGWPGMMFRADEAYDIFGQHRPTDDIVNAYPEYRVWNGGQVITDLAAEVNRLQSLPDEWHGAGIGIVMMVGDAKYHAMAYAAMKMMRKYVRWPITVWSQVPYSFGDVDDVTWAKLEGSDPIWKERPRTILESGYRVAMILDADAYPVADPCRVVQDAIDYGAAFWEDQPLGDRIDYSRYGLPATSKTRQIQGGVYCFDLAKVWKGLALTQWLNDRSDYFYQAAIADQTQMRAAWELLRLPKRFYGMVDHSRQTVFINEIDGVPAFVHRTGCKFKLDKLSNLPMEDEAWSLMEQGRRLGQY